MQGLANVGRGVAQVRRQSAAGCCAAVLPEHSASLPCGQGASTACSGAGKPTKLWQLVQVAVVAKDATVDAVSGALGKAGEPVPEA